jgi:RNA polymerase sigma factor (sigma-70 family)
MTPHSKSGQSDHPEIGTESMKGFRGHAPVGEHRQLVEQAMAGDETAFARLVQRHQGWVLGCAIALLGDYHLAQDVTQDAFAAAHTSLPTLTDPDAFAGWLKALVRHTCFRVMRRHRPDLVPLEFASEVSTAEPGPDWYAEEDEQRQEILSALATLTEEQRQVVLLHYWQEFSHRQIADRLKVPVSTINNRLHSARAQLREEMQIMVDRTTHKAALSAEAPEHAPVRYSGRIVATHGAVADVKFAFNDLPPLRSWLVPTDAAAGGKPLLTVVAYLGNGVARAVATGSRFNPRQGMMVVPVSSSRATPIDARVACDAVAQIVHLAHEQQNAAGARIETGIKAVDLFCPLVGGDVVGIAAGSGLGQMVLIQEVLQRRATRQGHLTLVAPIPAKNPLYAPGEKYGIGEVQTVYLPLRDVASPPPGLFDPVDATITLSLPLAKIGMWPAVDPQASSSRHLAPDIVGAEHVHTVARVRELLRRFPPDQEIANDQTIIPEEDRLLLVRARRLRRFLTQPFFVAGPWIRWSASFVPIAETIRGCREIVDGVYDILPEDAFYMASSIQEVIERANAAKL